MTKISSLSDIGTGVASNDTFVLVDASDPTTPNKKIQQQNLFLIPDGSQGTPALRFLNDTDVGLYRPTTNALGLVTGGSERLRITSAGLVGIGTSAPGATLHVEGFGNTVNQRIFTSDNVLNATASLTFGTTPGSRSKAAIRMINVNTGNAQGALSLLTDNGTFGLVDRLYIDGTGRVGIGTTNVDELLHVESDGATPKIKVESTLANSSPGFRVTNDARSYDIRIDGTNDNLQFYDATASQGRVAIDSSGRLLVGTSSAGASRNIYGGMELEASQAGNNAWAHLTQYGNSYTNRGARLYLNFTSGTSAGSATAVTTEDELGAIHFRGANGTTFQSAAEIRGEADTGTISGTSMPGRLVFSSTPSGSTTPVERMRITSAGVLQIADAGNIAVGTTTGTKIGTATTQKLGFFNATPVVQPAAVADATDAATVITQLNDLLAKLRTLGIIAT